MAVIGAGIVGVCSAMYLRREGFRVTLIERGEPGEACSAGNAGNLGVASCVPFSLPGIVWKVPRLMLDRSSPLAVRPAHLLSAMPWFVRFLRAGRRERVEEIADALRSLMQLLHDAYAPLVAEAGAEHLIARVGRLHVHQSEASFVAGRYAMDIRRRRGIAIDTLTGDQVREIEPALGPCVTAGYFIPEGAHCLNPLRFVKALAQGFVRGGGALLRAHVRGLDLARADRAVILTDAGRHEADAVVIAAGAWSGPLAAQLGARVPLEAERGYHAMVPNAVGLKVPVVDSESDVVLTPMEHGLRVSGMAEFAAVDAPPRYRYADMMLGHARKLLPGIGTDGAVKWMGPRPSLPDGKPIIDRSARYPRAYFAFGHGHVGLGTAAITGRLIGQLVAGRTPELDLEPFRHDRF